MGIEILNVGDRLLAAAINGVYQGVVITALVALSLRALGRTNAATRHAVWLCTMILLVSLVVAHCFVGSRSQETQSKEIAERVATSQAEMASATVVAVPLVAIENYFPEQDQPLGPNRDLLSLSPMTALTEMANPPVANLASLNAEPSEGKPGNSQVAVEQPAASDAKNAWFGKLMRRLANPIPPTFAIESPLSRGFGIFVLSVCIVLASLRILVLLLRLHQIRRLKRHSLPPSETINELFQNLVRRLDLRRKVSVKTSPNSQSFLLGFLHPVILLPNETQMEPGEAEQILRHELAHVQRWDDWANLIQHFILAAFPFHPAFWWISKRLSLEREIACDDHVLQSNAHPRAYALLLTNLAARWQHCPPLLAPGASTNKTQLQQRIDMILNTQRNKSPRLATTSLAFVASAALLFALTLIWSAPRIVLAQTEPTQPTAASPPDGAPVGAPGGEAPVAGAPSVASVAAAPTPEAPEPPAAPTPAATPKPASIAPGPKLKPGVSIAVAPHSVAITAPPAPAPPGAPVAFAAPAAPAAPVVACTDPSAEAKPARTPRPSHNRAADSSLEERLDRLERMVESLMARQGTGQDPFQLKQRAEIDRKDNAKVEAYAKHQAEVLRKQVIEPKEIEKIKEHAKVEAAQAADQAKRAAAEAKEAAKGEQKRQTRESKEGRKRQIEVLRRQIEGQIQVLEREKEKLEHQVEKLEHDQEKLDAELEDEQSSDSQSNASATICASTGPAQQ